MLAGLRQARRWPRWIELTRPAGTRRPFLHPCSVPEPLLVADVHWRASMDFASWQQQTNVWRKVTSPARRDKATKKRIAKTSGIRRLVRAAPKSDGGADRFAPQLQRQR